MPYFTFVGHRVRLLDWAAKREKIDHEEAQVQSASLLHTRDSSEQVTGTLHPKGMAAWWRDRNMFSLDGLPALSTAFRSTLGVGAHKPIPKATASSLLKRSSSSKTHPGGRQQPASSLGLNEARLSTFVSFTCLWEWITSAFAVIILFSPIIGYPPLSMCPSGTIHRDPTPHSRHKTGSSTSLADERISRNLRPILGYALSFLLGVVITVLISGSINRRIDGLRLVC